MKTIKYDQKLSPFLQRLIDQPLSYHFMMYEKGETIIAMDEATPYLAFVLDGKIQIYDLDLEGALHSIITSGQDSILGVVELLLDLPSPYFVQALLETTILAFPIEQPGLLEQKELLLVLARHLAQSQIQHSSVDLSRSQLEEKVLFYLDHKNNVITVQEMFHNLHCSRRHLQRVLKRLVENGQIVRIKQGVYKKKDPSFRDLREKDA